MVLGGAAKHWRLTVACVGAALALIGAGAAQGALLSGVLPGLISTPTASACGTASQPFLPWGDSLKYMLAPGGAFESGGPAWSTTGSVRVVAGNEPFHVNGAGDSHSLYIPSGSSATSPSMCYAAGDQKMRLFVTSSGTTSLSALKVSVVNRSLVGSLLVDSGSIRPSASWAPSSQVALTLTNLQGLLTTDSISFRFAAVGPGSWRIDDVYLDPWKDP